MTENKDSKAVKEENIVPINHPVIDYIFVSDYHLIVDV